MVTEDKKGQVLTREEIKKQKKIAQKKEKDAKKEQKLDKKIKKFRKRLIPIWLRIILVVLFSAVALAVGLMVGYGIIGEGEPMDALKWSTWEHIRDIVFKEE